MAGGEGAGFGTVPATNGLSVASVLLGGIIDLSALLSCTCKR